MREHEVSGWGGEGKREARLQWDRMQMGCDGRAKGEAGRLVEGQEVQGQWLSRREGGREEATQLAVKQKREKGRGQRRGPFRGARAGASRGGVRKGVSARICGDSGESGRGMGGKRRRGAAGGEASCRGGGGPRGWRGVRTNARLFVKCGG